MKFRIFASDLRKVGIFDAVDFAFDVVDFATLAMDN